MRIIIAILLLASSAFAQDLTPYRPLLMGRCEDVKAVCALMVPKDTDLFYAVIENGRVIAITRVRDGKEETIWGLLPNEKRL